VYAFKIVIVDVQLYNLGFQVLMFQNLGIEVSGFQVLMFQNSGIEVSGFQV
jgi:hypothetical protein